MPLRSNFVLSSAARSEIGKVRKHNEDNYLELIERGLWAVADGMGGHEAGEIASAAIVDALKNVQPIKNLRNAIQLIENLLSDCNDNLRKMAASRGRNQIIGATVVVLIIHERLAAYLWAGDCRLYLYRRGELKQLTQDHTQVEEMIKMGLLDREHARGHPNANIVTRAVGAMNNLLVDYYIEQIEPGDRFLLCSDGLDKELEDFEITKLLAQGNDKEAVDNLINLALSRKGRDNVTVITVTADIKKLSVTSE